MTHEQQAILDLCDRVQAIEATLGLRLILSAAPALPELTHRVTRIEAAIARTARPVFHSRRPLLSAAQFNSRRSA